MAITPRDNPEYGGFENPSEGWHRMIVQEGIELAKNKDGEFVTSEINGKTYQNVTVNLAVDGGEEDGRRVTQWCLVGMESGEQKLADIMGATGVWKKFAEKYPGLGDTVSLFDPKVFSAIQMRLPNNPLQVKIYHQANKDGKVNARVKSIAHISVDVNTLEKSKGGKKEAVAKVDKKAAAPAPAPAAGTGDDW